MRYTKTGRRIFKRKSFIISAVKTGRIMAGYRPRKVKGGYVAVRR